MQRAPKRNSIASDSRTVASSLRGCLVVEPGDTDAALLEAARVLESTWQLGRKVLVVLGAGASVEAHIPSMADVYTDLASRIEREFGEHGPIPKGLPADLVAWLQALANCVAPRSLASMALGTLQSAHERVAIDGVYAQLARVWQQFSVAFVAGDIACRSDAVSRRESLGAQLGPAPLWSREPAPIHELVAKWAVEDRATLVSVNFDGLTQKALRKVLHTDATATGESRTAVVLSDPESVRNFYLRRPHILDNSDKMVSVVKIWGDVFHALCKNPRCPACEVRVPIFKLGEPSAAHELSASGDAILACPACAQPRQLQIFFPGYEQKERATQQLMECILKFIVQDVGCVLTVGFSGLWDRALVDLLAAVCSDLERGVETLPRPPSLICIDPDPHPYLLYALSRHGITPHHVRCRAGECSSFLATRKLDVWSQAAHAEKVNTPPEREEALWLEFAKDLYDKGQLSSLYRHLTSNTYVADFRYLRQLGIKTGIARSSDARATGGTHSPELHNRRVHSRGVAHVALKWFDMLSRAHLPPSSRLVHDQLRTVVLYAAIHHDLGHLPFTHLAEEIFEEVRWKLRDWGDPFRHDEPVLTNAAVEFGDDLKESVEMAATRMGLPDSTFKQWVESAIHGRSGFPWVDAILNSPLDADKVDYVFRDCVYLDQGLHIARHDNARWVRELLEAMEVLPSGVIALRGVAGDRAREFLLERWWLYRNQYFRRGYRVLERIARSVIIQWLLRVVALDVVGSEQYGVFTSRWRVMQDPAALKGRVASRLLWQKMREVVHVQRSKRAADEPVSGRQSDQEGEVALLYQLADELATPSATGIPEAPNVSDWARRCKEVLATAMRYSGASVASLSEYLRKEARVTFSDSFYVRERDLRVVREIARRLETERPFRALFDLAVMPPMLSYPARRRWQWAGKGVVSECYAVSHRDPERWGVASSRSIPMSESMFADVDRDRWVKVMVVSPYENDPEVGHARDRFWTSCKERDIDITEEEPRTLFT